MIAANNELKADLAQRCAPIIIDATHLRRIEGLAEGALHRNPALADRLLEELSRARIVESEHMPVDVVSIGSVVTYRDDIRGQEKSVTLVYPEDADISRLQVSLMTPIGVALLGLSEGSDFYWDTRDNQQRMLVIIRVEQPILSKTPLTPADAL